MVSKQVAHIEKLAIRNPYVPTVGHRYCPEASGQHGGKVRAPVAVGHEKKSEGNASQRGNSGNGDRFASAADEALPFHAVEDGSPVSFYGRSVRLARAAQDGSEPHTEEA